MLLLVLIKLLGFPLFFGDFNLKFAYSVWFDREFSYHSQLLKELWKIKGPQRLKMFMWVMVNDALLTNHVRARKGLSSLDTCILCGSSSDTTLHALRNCIYVKELWKSIDYSFITNSFFQQPYLVGKEYFERNSMQCWGQLSLTFSLRLVTPYGIAITLLFLKGMLMLILFLIIGW